MMHGVPEGVRRGGMNRAAPSAVRDAEFRQVA